jgi:hypothetical protein
MEIATAMNQRSEGVKYLCKVEKIRKTVGTNKYMNLVIEEVTDVLLPMYLLISKINERIKIIISHKS